MTPTAEWHEADADDSDRSITDDVTDNAPETARAATETGATGARVHGDADLLRKRTAALDRVAAENERLRGIRRELESNLQQANLWSWEQHDRAEAAEAKLRGVEAHMGPELLKAVLSHRAVLARSQAPQAPAEQREDCARCGLPREQLARLDAPDDEAQ